jgi:hypothetical protein
MILEGDILMAETSRRKAKSWPYQSHQSYEKLLRENSSKWFIDHNYEHDNRYKFILKNRDDWQQNILVEEVAQYVKNEKEKSKKENKPFPLHRFVHHGLSSQAMLFNLVGPLIVKNEFGPLKAAFNERNIPWPEGEFTSKFEYENRSLFQEFQAQPTSIDLVLQSNDLKNTLFIESKLVEHQFGPCSKFTAGDCDGRNPVNDFSLCYQHFIGRQYWILLKKHGFLKGLMSSSPICPLAMYHQFFREVLFAIESGGNFVLIYDERNPTFYCGDSTNRRGLIPFLLNFIPDEIKCHVFSISIQQIVKSYEGYPLLSWVIDFKKKYGIL